MKKKFKIYNVAYKIFDKCMYLNPKFFGKIFSKIKNGENYAELYQSIKANKDLKNIHKGERCFVLGNGPSLKNQDLSLLENEYVFSVNQIARNKDFEKIKPTYHFWADTCFFDIDKDNGKNLELFETMKAVKTENNNPTVFYLYRAFEMIKKTQLDKLLNIRYFKTEKSFEEKMDKSIDFTKNVGGMNTVVQFAICMAIYMGFSEINFLGCDMTGLITSINLRLQNALENDYAYELSEQEKERMKEKTSNVSFEAELNACFRVIKEYRLLSDYCNKRGIKLCNCTPGGLVEGVQRQKYEELFKTEKE